VEEDLELLAEELLDDALLAETAATEDLELLASELLDDALLAETAATEDLELLYVVAAAEDELFTDALLADTAATEDLELETLDADDAAATDDELATATALLDAASPPVGVSPALTRPVLSVNAFGHVTCL